MPKIIIEVSSKGVGVIPRQIREQLGLTYGGSLEGKLSEKNELILTRPAPALLDSWVEIRSCLYAGEVDSRLKAAIAEINYAFMEKAKR